MKRHLRSYSIVQRRKTTVNHAFASALAPCDDYDEKRVTEAMALLGQTDFNDLRCVYCDSVAETWDHLVGLVKDSELNGYGHQIGNLVPCCGDFNSSKGNKDWREFLRSRIADLDELKRVEQALETYLLKYATEVDLGRVQDKYPEEWHKYNEIKSRIIELMAEADGLAAQLRTGEIA
jgi:hypothetical protein